MKDFVTSNLGRGETGSIILAGELRNSLLIIDDFRARKVALDLGLDITGTLGVLLLAKKRGLIDSIREAIFDIKQTNFRISETLIKQTLKKAGE